MTARGWLLFAAVSVVWGVPYFFIKVAVDADVPPAFVAWSRLALASVLLVPLAARRGLLGQLSGHWRPIVAYMFCEMAIPFVLISVGEQHVASSLAAILIASMPLMVALLSIPFAASDRPTGIRLVGLFVGLAGVIALLGIDVAGETDELIGAALILVATLCYALAPMIVDRSLTGLDPLGPVAASVLLATIVLLPAAVVAPPDEVPSGDALASIVALGVLCTAIGLLLFFRLIADAGPSRASLITYFNPLVAVVLGVLVLDEHLGAASLAGLVLILAGSWLATRGSRQPAAASP